MAKRLTEDEVDQIIELKMNRVPVRAIAARVGCTPKTVQRRWDQFVTESRARRAEQHDSELEELILRQDQIAADARRLLIRARQDNDHQASARFLAEERQALREKARLQGLDAAAKIEHSGTVEIASPKDALAAALDLLAEIGGEPDED